MASLNSMTGFARTSGAIDDCNWLWEIKSVNGRGLETRCRIPAGFDRIEEAARKKVKSRFQRGSINLHLQLSFSGGRTTYQVNTEFLKELEAIASQLVSEGKAERPTADGLLGLRGVIDTGDAELDEGGREALEAALLSSLDEALAKLAATREEEGAQLLPVIEAQIAEITALVEAAEGSAAARPEKVRERFHKQLELILGETKTVDENRLEQELAVLATKADVAEEIDRLKGHVQTVQDLLKDKKAGAVGRRLDFICQEFNREANTLCSKAGDKDLTKIGVDLKVIIDRLREQVQNIE